jgi:hypothetical protein
MALSMMAGDYRLIIVRNDGRTQVTTAHGYLAESLLDAALNKAKTDDNILFAVLLDGPDSIRREFRP